MKKPSHARSTWHDAFAGGQSVEKNIRFQTKGIRVDKGPIESNSRKYVWGCLYPGGAPNNGLYGEALPERGIFLRLQVYERVEILLVEVHQREGKSVIWVCERV